MNYSVPDTLLNKILGYLGNRPYVEVFEIVQGIQQLAAQQAPPSPAVESTPTPEAEQQSN